ncbi:hypothetical protein ACIPSA_48750 [Streptomyces sp. NPDC086549]|uniref:hypothetical protein n=1 Tax=Streptomyces sp. NPDC086549 TaxID=3365752 RepID=UPI003802ADB6
MAAETTGLDPVTIKAFLAFGMLLNNGAALQIAELDEPWAEGARTRIRPGLLDHITQRTRLRPHPAPEPDPGPKPSEARRCCRQIVKLRRLRTCWSAGLA